MDWWQFYMNVQHSGRKAISTGLDTIFTSNYIVLKTSCGRWKSSRRHSELGSLIDKDPGKIKFQVVTSG